MSTQKNKNAILQPTTRIRLTNPNVTNLENEYFGDFEVEYKNEGTKSTKIYIKFAIKKELRPDVQVYS